jgi:hypothetical protein
MGIGTVVDSTPEYMDEGPQFNSPDWQGYFTSFFPQLHIDIATTRDNQNT